MNTPSLETLVEIVTSNAAMAIDQRVNYPTLQASINAYGQNLDDTLPKELNQGQRQIVNALWETALKEEAAKVGVDLTDIVL